MKFIIFSILIFLTTFFTLFFQNVCASPYDRYQLMVNDLMALQGRKTMKLKVVRKDVLSQKGKTREKRYIQQNELATHLTMPLPLPLPFFFWIWAHKPSGWDTLFPQLCKAGMVLLRLNFVLTKAQDLMFDFSNNLKDTLFPISDKAKPCSYQ